MGLSEVSQRLRPEYRAGTLSRLSLVSSSSSVSPSALASVSPLVSPSALALAPASERARTRNTYIHGDHASAPPAAQAVARWLNDYLRRTPQDPEFELDPRIGTTFQRQVWKLLMTVPFGAWTSYGALASALGRPTAARAVGQAVASNPFLLVVPCHRVLAHNGELGGFSAGLEVKRIFLHHEGLLASPAPDVHRVDSAEFSPVRNTG